jgi:tetratricopeptide (TPR) repeat protein
VKEIAAPPLPAGYAGIDTPYGVLTCIPVVWLALAVRLAWRDRPAEARAVLRGFVMTVALLFGICTLTIALFSGAAARYEVEFLPALLLLAVAGILGLERALAHRPVWRRTARCLWGLLLGFSVAFNLFASVNRYDHAHMDLGGALIFTGNLDEAVGQFEQSLRVSPANEQSHFYLGLALTQEGRIQEAIQHYQEAVKLQPDFADAHNNLGNLLAQTGKPDEAVGQYEQAIRIKPDYLLAHYNLGVVLYELGRVPEAIGHWEQALRINPNYDPAKKRLSDARAAQ